MPCTIVRWRVLRAGTKRNVQIERRSSWSPVPDQPLAAALVIALIVLGACIIGIQSRSLLGLASLWPANAVLLALLTLHPRANLPLTWVLSAMAFVGADVMAGTDIVMAGELNGANLVGIAVGVFILTLRGSDAFSMQSPASIAVLVLAMVMASISTGLVGALVGQDLIGAEASEAFFLWFATELVNYAVFLPIILSANIYGSAGWGFLSGKLPDQLQQLAAVFTLLVSCVLMVAIEGPGTYVLPLPALIWCGILFRAPLVTALSAASGIWVLLAVPKGWVRLHVDLGDVTDLASVRLGVAIVLIAAFSVSALNEIWRRLVAELEHASSHDPLTGLHNRASFLATAGSTLMGGVSGCVLMLDIDRFKSINDSFGHATGDIAIERVARVIDSQLRRADIAGRLGGEEFAVLLVGANLIQAQMLAERIRGAVAEQLVDSDSGPLRVTISIGVAEVADGLDLKTALAAADHALYQAKGQGRDLVVALQRPELALRRVS